MKKSAYIYIVLAGILWGSSGIFVHFLAPYGYNSLQMASVRGFVGAVSLAVYVLIWNKKLFRFTWRELLLSFASGVSMYVAAASYYAAMQASSVSTAVILMYTSPILVMLYSVLFFGERLTKGKLVAVIGMIIGCALVSGVVGGMKFSIGGILLGILSSIAYSSYNIFTKVQMQRQCNPVTASMYSFIFMFLSSVVVSRPWQVVSLAAENPVSIWLLLGCGVCTCALPYFLYTLAMQYLPAGTACALGIMEPLAATVFSVVFLKEQLTIPSLCGIIIIVGAVFLLSRIKET